MDTPTLDEGQHDSTASRPSRARAFLPRGMADRDMSGGRSGPMAAVASGGGSSGVPGGAPAAAAAVTAAPPPVSGIRKGDSGAVADLPAMRTGGGSASATGASTLWPTLSIPDVNAGGGDVGDRGNDGGGGGGVGGGDDGGVGGGGSGVGGGGSGIGGGGSGVGGAGSFLRVGSALRRADSSMHRSETGRARLMHKLSSPRPPPGPGEWAALELARQQTAERLGADTRLAMDEPEKPGKAVDDEAKEEARAAKEKKELQKKIKDYMKTALSSERTFFKWIWTTLNLGALGTIALTFFHDDGFPYRLIVVAIAWLMGLFFALYGLRQFHLRRKALLSVTDDPETWESPNAPAIVVAAFVIMMLTIIVYAIASGQQFGFRTRAQLYGGTSDQ